MTKLLNSIHGAENKFDIVAEQFLFHHPLLGGLIIFIGIPIFILIAVTFCITSRVYKVPENTRYKGI